MKTLSAVLCGGSAPWVLLQDSSHTACPVGLLLPQPEVLWLSGSSAHKCFTPGETGFGFRAAEDHRQPWDNSTSCKRVRTFHLTPNMEMLPYSTAYFFFQNWACVHTNPICRGCLLFGVTKQARWPSLLQWQPSATSPRCVFFKEKLLQNPNTTTLQHQS